MRSVECGARNEQRKPSACVRPDVALRLFIPHSAFRTPHPPVRPGYTLVELTLVLAILGALAAVAWPSVLRMQADHELSSSAEQVRQQLGQARTKAIHAGLAYQFRLEPKGRHFCVIPFEADPTVTTNSSRGAKPALEPRFAGEISKRIAFQPSTNDATSSPAGQKVPEAAFQGMPDAGTLAAVSWSGPLIFQGDGTAADAVITLGDVRGHRVDITLRGLTGAASVGPMRREAVR